MVVRTSRIHRVRDSEKQQQISSVLPHQGFVSLQEEVHEARQEYFLQVAKGLATSKDPVDQRLVDELRGFWKGAVWALEVFPKLTDRDWQRYVAKALEESEANA